MKTFSKQNKWLGHHTLGNKEMKTNKTKQRLPKDK